MLFSHQGLVYYIFTSDFFFFFKSRCNIPLLISIWQYMYCNSHPDYMKSGNVTLKFQIINQRADVSFALFSNGVQEVGYNYSFSQFSILYIKWT